MRNGGGGEVHKTPLLDDRGDGDVLAFASSLWAATPQAALCAFISAMPRHSPWHTLLRDACAHASARAEGINDGHQPPMVVAGVVLGVSAAHGAALADTAVGERFLCVSLGSGTRCSGAATPRQGCEGSLSDQQRTTSSLCREAFIMRDGHAEVMARRGFVAFLLDAVDEAVAQNGYGASPGPHLFVERHSCVDGATPPRCRAQSTSTATPPPNPAVVVRGGWALRSGVRVHLVCTHWPCGALSSLVEGEPSGGLLVAVPSMSDGGNDKVADAVDGGTTRVCGHYIARHRTQLDSNHAALRATRTKPGKGNPNLNMSCTDKLWRWSVLGLQGRRRAHLFPHPIPLHALHIAVTNKTTSVEVLVTVAAMLAQRNAYLRDTDVRSSATLSTAVGQLGREGAPLAVHTFAVEELAPPGRLSTATTLCRAQSATLGVCDSAYSRSMWLTGGAARGEHMTREWAERTRCSTTSGQLPGMKRARGQGGTDGGASCSYTSASLVLNTKAGLPQGTGLAQLQRHLCAAATVHLLMNTTHIAGDGTDDKVVDADVQQRSVAAQLAHLTAPYPLSRAWMATRVWRLCATRRVDAALPSHTLDVDDNDMTVLGCMMRILGAHDKQLRLPVRCFCATCNNSYVCGGSMPVLLHLIRPSCAKLQPNEDALLWVEKNTPTDVKIH